MKILFAGLIQRPEMSSSSRWHAFERLGHTVYPFDTTPFERDTLFLTSLKKRTLPCSLYERTLSRRAAACGAGLLEMARRYCPEVIWLEWPRLIDAETICSLKQALPGARLVSFQDDNPFGLRRRVAYGWSRFLEAIPYYDLHFVKRDSDLSQYRALGARRSAICMGGYCENTFYPPKDKLPSADYGVVFIGTPLDGRAGALGELLGRLGTPVDIFGTRWKRTKLYPKWKKLLHPPVATDTYRETLWRAQIALGFVSSSNLDEFTLRSFEIPASGTFFLAERTPTHQQLYVEGREAEFFNGIEECRDKIAYYLQHDEQRRKIAQAGRRRCLESGYGNERRLQQALEQVWQS